MCIDMTASSHHLTSSCKLAIAAKSSDKQLMLSACLGVHLCLCSWLAFMQQSCSLMMRAVCACRQAEVLELSKVDINFTIFKSDDVFLAVGV